MLLKLKEKTKNIKIFQNIIIKYYIFAIIYYYIFIGKAKIYWINIKNENNFYNFSRILYVKVVNIKKILVF